MAVIVSILGCGWFGTALAKHLLIQGYNVKGSATSLGKVQFLQELGVRSYQIVVGDNVGLDTVQSDFWRCDALIIASNVKLTNNTGYASGLKEVRKIIRSRGIKKTIFISSTSVYGEPNQIINESAACIPEQASASMLMNLEALFQNLPGLQTTVLRFGGLVGPGRFPGSFFRGRKGVPNGLAPVNLIHLKDSIGITMRLLQMDQIPACINAVAPDHPTKADFYSRAAEVQGFDAPEFISELLSWKIVQSKYQEELRYEYLITNWIAWLNSEEDRGG